MPPRWAPRSPRRSTFAPSRCDASRLPTTLRLLHCAAELNCLLYECRLRWLAARRHVGPRSWRTSLEARAGMQCCQCPPLVHTGWLELVRLHYSRRLLRAAEDRRCYSSISRVSGLRALDAPSAPITPYEKPLLQAFERQYGRHFQRTCYTDVAIHECDFANTLGLHACLRSPPNMLCSRTAITAIVDPILLQRIFSNDRTRSCLQA
mmetsp:Transcript_12590/g.20801  ORF Transcript_12590/g.20801 Transcript_12590/m.20801 type:complete len:207 (+) Transcript_12590:660-1280(+)